MKDAGARTHFITCVAGLNWFGFRQAWHVVYKLAPLIPHGAMPKEDSPECPVCCVLPFSRLINIAYRLTECVDPRYERCK